MGIDVADIMTRLIKYAIEGLAVAIAAYYIPSKGKMSIGEVGMIALSALATFAILDIYAPAIGAGAKQGAGFGIGANFVGFPA